MKENEVYLFGGMTEGYKCDDAGVTDTGSEGDVSAGVEVNRCRRQAGVNNDLWQLETKTGQWKVVFENEDVATKPPPREGHSANVMGDGTMLMFGGKTLQAGDVTGSNKTNIYLGDMWEVRKRVYGVHRRRRLSNVINTLSSQLDIADPTQHTVTGAGSGLPSGTLPQTLKEGVMEYFTVNASLSQATVGGNGELEGELCINSVDVELTLTHNCVKDLQIGLYGPGPRTGDKNFHPENRADRVQLFGMFAGDRGCGSATGISAAKFSDAGVNADVTADA